jgi:hypothetical protein
MVAPKSIEPIRYLILRVKIQIRVTQNSQKETRREFKELLKCWEEGQDPTENPRHLTCAYSFMEE